MSQDEDGSPHKRSRMSEPVEKKREQGDDKLATSIDVKEENGALCRCTSNEVCCECVTQKPWAAVFNKKDTDHYKEKKRKGEKTVTAIIKDIYEKITSRNGRYDYVTRVLLEKLEEDIANYLALYNSSK